MPIGFQTVYAFHSFDRPHFNRGKKKRSKKISLREHEYYLNVKTKRYSFPGRAFAIFNRASRASFGEKRELTC